MWKLCVYIRVAIVLELAGKEGKRGGVAEKYIMRMNCMNCVMFISIWLLNR